MIFPGGSTQIGIPGINPGAPLISAAGGWGQLPSRAIAEADTAAAAMRSSRIGLRAQLLRQFLLWRGLRRYDSSYDPAGAAAAERDGDLSATAGESSDHQHGSRIATYGAQTYGRPQQSQSQQSLEHAGYGRAGLTTCWPSRITASIRRSPTGWTATRCTTSRRVTRTIRRRCRWSIAN